MIKNARSLNENERLLLEHEYKSYFLEDCQCNVEKPFKAAAQKLFSGRYAKEAVRRIYAGYSSCVVDLDENDVIRGFMTGYVEGNVATLAHSRIKGNTRRSREIKLALFKELLEDLKKQNAMFVVASASPLEYRFVDLINTLGFSQVGDTDRWVLQDGESQKHL